MRDFAGQLTELTVRRNFSLVYEILDEMIDAGVPQISDTAKLRPLVLQFEGVGGSLPTPTPATSSSLAPPTGATTTTNRGTPTPPASSLSTYLTQLRPSPLRGSAPPLLPTLGGGVREEFFVDVIEHLSLLYHASGRLIRTDIQGSLVCRSNLPENVSVRVGLTPGVVIASRVGHGDDGDCGRVSPGTLAPVVLVDDVNLHAAVQSDELDTKGVLVLPQAPAGQFDVMQYRVSRSIRPPFRVSTKLTRLSTDRVALEVRLRAEFPEQMSALAVHVRIPTPDATTRVHVERLNGGDGSPTTTSSATTTATMTNHHHRDRDDDEDPMYANMWSSDLSSLPLASSSSSVLGQGLRPGPWGRSGGSSSGVGFGLGPSGLVSGTTSRAPHVRQVGQAAKQLLNTVLRQDWGTTTAGDVLEYLETQREVLLRVSRVMGGTTVGLKATITVEEGHRADPGDVRVAFQLPKYNASGLTVQYVSLDQHPKAQTYVRYVTQSASVVYQVADRSGG